MELFTVIVGLLSLILLVLQLPAFFLLIARLLPGARRQPPILPRRATAEQAQKVSVIVPTLNEVHRLEPCLTGLSQQGNLVREIVVVDSRSTDGTPAKVNAIAARDPRIRLITDDLLPTGWVGRPWALHTGFLQSHGDSEWILGVDADTRPQLGLVASLLSEAQQQGYDIVSLSPRFILQGVGEWWLQPALLMTLLYRAEAAGVKAARPDRVMANGQCFLSRRSVLATLGGYTCAANSFCDDVTLARAAARAGFKVGFLNGADVLSVRMYEGLGETWQGWGRSLDLRDATPAGQLWTDLWVLVCTQALPIPVLILLGLGWGYGAGSLMLGGAIALNICLLLIRLGMQVAIAGSYHWPQTGRFTALFFALSPLADPLAVLRIILSAFQPSIQWRGRSYQKRL